MPKLVYNSRGHPPFSRRYAAMLQGRLSERVTYSQSTFLFTPNQLFMGYPDGLIFIIIIVCGQALFGPGQVYSRLCVFLASTPSRSSSQTISSTLLQGTPIPFCSRKCQTLALRWYRAWDLWVPFVPILSGQACVQKSLQNKAKQNKT